MKKSIAWPYVVGKIDRSSPLLHMTLLPGDVVLTTRSGLLSAAIRRAADVPVSHAALMVTSEWALEARDPGLEVNDATGGVYLSSREELVTLGLVDHIVVRRPHGINTDHLQRWALERLSTPQSFASAGLAMMPALRALAQLDDALDGVSATPHRRAWTRVRTRQAVLAEAVADGKGMVICAELVYRGLLAAGCQLDLADAFFRDAISTLPPALPDVPSLVVDDPTLAIVTMATSRSRTPGSAQVPSQRMPRLGLTAWSNFRRRWTERHEVHLPGDQADLVTPGDLMRLPPLSTVSEFRLLRGRWHRVDH